MEYSRAQREAGVLKLGRLGQTQAQAHVRDWWSKNARMLAFPRQYRVPRVGGGGIVRSWELRKKCG